MLISKAFSKTAKAVNKELNFWPHLEIIPEYFIF